MLPKSSMVLGWKATLEKNVLFLLGRKTHDLHQKHIPGIKATDSHRIFPEEDTECM